MNNQELLVFLKNRERKGNENMLSEARKREELEFHNRTRDAGVIRTLSEKDLKHLYSNNKYYSVAQLSKNYVDQWLRTNARGKVFLDYACGNGKNTIKAAKAGASLAVGLDISDVSISNAKEDARKEGVESNVFFYHGDCEDTQLPNECVDAIICDGMLHHLDLHRAFKEMHRILKPNGRVMGYEALKYNPIIQLYRVLTPQMRTEWEKDHILSHKELRLAAKYFSVQNINYWHLLSMLAVPFKNTGLFKPALKLFNCADAIILKIPGVRLMSWMFTFELVKKSSASG